MLRVFVRFAISAWLCVQLCSSLTLAPVLKAVDSTDGLRVLVAGSTDYCGVGSVRAKLHVCAAPG